MANATWDLVPPLPAQNLVGFKWAYQVEYRSDGSVDMHKARLVA